MSGIVRIKLYIDTGFAACRHQDYAEIDRAEWDAMTPEEQEKHLDQEARDYLANNIDYGAYVVEDGDDEN